MLAEPRRKKKDNFPLLVCGKPYYDKNGFGMKMLKQMGWQEGCGLGTNLQGLSCPIRPKYNFTRKGFSARDEKCVDFIDHQKSFNDLLADLNAASQETCGETVTMSSLEERSRKSRRHIHYHKFTRGKDVSQYSLKDFEGIMGKKVTQDSLAVLKKIPCNSTIPVENLPKIIEGLESSFEKDTLAFEDSSIVTELESLKQEGKKRKRTRDGIANENTSVEKENESTLTGRRVSYTFDHQIYCEDQVETRTDISKNNKKKKCIYGNVEICAVQSITLQENASDKRTKKEKQKKNSVERNNFISNSIAEQNVSSRYGSVIREDLALLSPDCDNAIQNDEQLKVDTRNFDINQSKEFIPQSGKRKEEKENKSACAHLKDINLQSDKKKMKTKKRRKNKYELGEAVEKSSIFLKEDTVCNVSCKKLSNTYVNEGSNMLVEHTHLKQQCDLTETGCKDQYDAICSAFIGANLHSIKGYGNY